ncbi:hypothetical protein Enr10x_21050 [Gimesia panareensis]|uniref:Uncharacterized protein n=1 Tax=Gimesia panareensis TaxID=2527978 RepID=A0A517Q589_9PLAN|nr:hypothetical protein [Gimesia panareensis]QDT26795.1 hypothetical protein Enr10x_21050 [Gimesia panareensis]
MSAPIVHAGLTFPGIHQDLIFGTPELKRQKNVIFSLKGATSLNGEIDTREITVEHWLFNGYSYAELIAALSAIKDHASVKGTLVDSLGTTFSNVEFLRQEPIQGPLYDPVKGWWKKIRLVFEELTP